jgi:hypothetical protein
MRQNKKEQLLGNFLKADDVVTGGDIFLGFAVNSSVVV